MWNSFKHRLPAVVAALALAATALVGTAAAPSAHAVEVPPTDFQNLDGLPLHSITAPGSAVGEGPNGEPWIYLVSSGSPSAFLSVVDARTGDRVHSFEMPGAGGSWSVTVAPNGDVYIGSYGEGHLFRWQPGSEAVEDLGSPTVGETYMWTVTHDAEGTIYGGSGTHGAHIVGYDPQADSFTDFGPLSLDDESLSVKGVATSSDGMVYGLTAPTPRLVELDPETGEYSDLPLPPTADPSVGGYDLDIRGDLLFARFVGQPSPLHVMDLNTKEWVQEIPGAYGLRLSEMASDGHTFYFVKDGQLWSYDLTDRSYTSTGVDTTGTTDRRGFGFLELGVPEWPGETLVGLDWHGQYQLYSPTTGRSESRNADAVAASADIRSIIEGPDGLVYAGSYLAGGLASYDPETGEKVAFAPEVGQAEGMAVHDGMLYVGTYPQSEIFQYDPSQPAVPGENPRVVMSLDEVGQSRPNGMVSAGRYLAVGTVPANGTRGGGLALLDPDTGEYWFDEVVPGHSVVGLVFMDGILYGSTSVYSGVGGPRPDETDGVIFAMDVESREMLWQTRPLPGVGSFGQLTFDAEGTLWTQGPMTLIALDPDTGDLLRSQNYGSYPWEDIDHVYGTGMIWVDPYIGQIGTVSQAKMFMTDEETLQRVRYVRPISHGFLHSNGTVYLARSTNFYSLRFEDDRQTPTVTVAEESVLAGEQQQVVLDGFGPGELVELWSQPEGRLIDTLNVDQNGHAEVAFTTQHTAGQARVAVTRLQTRGQLLADYEVRSWPTWSAESTYLEGDRVSYDDRIFEAQWWTRGETPGSSSVGAWAEVGAPVTCEAGGTTVWTDSWIYDDGDVVAHDGHRWQAGWWTRNQDPGEAYGPWTDLGSC